MSKTRLAALTFGIAVVLGACAAPASSEDVATSTDALDVCAAGDTLQGVDVSHHNATVDWTKVKASGRSFAFARTSDGLTTPDTEFHNNWPNMKKAGLVRGAYQFFRPKRDPVATANLIVQNIADNGGLEVGDLPPVLDLEVTDGVADATVVAEAQTWLDRVEKLTGVKPIVYTGNNMTSVIGTHFASYTLWVAHYEVDCPRMPGGWTNWTFWQNGEAGSVPGITTGGTDTDFFNGQAADLDSVRIKAAVHIDTSDLQIPAAAAIEGKDGDAWMGSTNR